MVSKKECTFPSLGFSNKAGLQTSSITRDIPNNYRELAGSGNPGLYRYRKGQSNEVR